MQSICKCAEERVGEEKTNKPQCSSHPLAPSFFLCLWERREHSGFYAEQAFPERAAAAAAAEEGAAEEATEEEEEAAASTERKRGRRNCIVVIFRNTLMQQRSGVWGGRGLWGDCSAAAGQQRAENRAPIREREQERSAGDLISTQAYQRERERERGRAERQRSGGPKCHSPQAPVSLSTSPAPSSAVDCAALAFNHLEPFKRSLLAIPFHPLVRPHPLAFFFIICVLRFAKESSQTGAEKRKEGRQKYRPLGLNPISITIPIYSVFPAQFVFRDQSSRFG